MGGGCRFSKKLLDLEMEYSSGDKIEKNDLGGACNAYGGDERRIQDFGGEI
jgi:hypothetical protein